MKKPLVLAASAALMLSACATDFMAYKTGTEITAEQLAQFQPGVSTQAQVQAAVGAPNRRESLNGKELWHYDFNKIRHIGANVNEATVFEWDASGKLLQTYKTGSTARTGNALIDAANGR